MATEVLYTSCPQLGSQIYVTTTVPMKSSPSPPTLLDKIKNFFLCESIERKKKNKQLPENAFRLRKFLGITILSSVFLVSLVGSGVMWFTDIYVEEIINQMTIRPGSEVFEAWKKPPMKLLICIHIFNYTNMPEYMAKIDDKIKIEEVGPYCYRETQMKKNVTFNSDGTVTYGDVRKHEFDPIESKGSPNDTLVVPNLALIGALGMTKNLNFLMKLSLSMFLKNIIHYKESMMEVKADQFILGYDDKLVKLGLKLAKLLKAEIPFDKFGLLSARATETDDSITVRTGTNDVDRIGIVTEVNGEPQMYAWPGEECNRIDGSDGAFFPRRTINESATLYLFHKDMCRRMPFVFGREVEFQEGVKAMRFVPAPQLFQSKGTCFCLNNTFCPPDGVFDTSPCHEGAPVLMSFPHFLHSDPILSAPFEGLRPDPEKHSFHIDIQRMLGFTVDSVSRIQMNMQVRKSRGYEGFLKEFPDKMILPIAWLQVSTGKMPDSLFRVIYHATFTVKRMQIALRWGTLLLTAVTFFFLIRYIRRKPATAVEDPSSKENRMASQEMLSGGPSVDYLTRL
ncbi:scavenger receptor class B, member [Nesidiocoris tenuis]|uniref:Scavenger receptor class B member 1 n=1 Tax=Nesidiocoris tenuis TaxID=355587 RepID=A0ABN7A5L4_9HEMI|nr:scavenger receptor class B, member [Nesidiocoris tenuis]